MPIISAGVTIPGTQVHLGVRLAHQTQAEKEADRAMDIQEDDARARAGDRRVDPVRSRFDELLASPSPLDRLGPATDDPDRTV